jgi:ribosomal protein L37E
MSTAIYCQIDDALCPQCGLGPAELVRESWPVVMRVLGNSVHLRCWVCGKDWLHKQGQES